jgi:hypothetical protein
MSQAQADALVKLLPPATPAQLEAGMAYLNAHPLLVSGQLIAATSYRGVTPNVSIGLNWWGIRLNLTNGDIHQILQLVLIAGFAGAGDLLCGGAGPVAVGCAIVGTLFGYIVAEIVWNQLWNNHGCGAYIQDRWAYPAGWSWGLAC